MPQITILLPPDATPLVQVGDVLRFETEIARVSQKPTVSQTLPIADTLQFKPAKIFKHLKKSIGDKVYKGDVVAVRDAVFATKKYIADADGVLTSVNHHSGEIVIEQTSSEETKSVIRALVDGSVANIEKDKIVCKVKQVLTVDLLDATKERVGGKVVVTDDTSVMQLSLPQIQGNIVVSADVSEYVTAKLEALGVSYIVVSQKPEIPSSQLLALREPKDMQSIIDFAPHGVYANAAENSVTFYK